MFKVSAPESHTHSGFGDQKPQIPKALEGSKHGSTSGLCSLHHRSIRVQNWEFYTMYYSILYCTILYKTMLCYTILYYTILYYTILYYTILYYTILYLYYTILYYTILYYTILYYTILYYTSLYHTIYHSMLIWILPGLWVLATWTLYVRAGQPVVLRRSKRTPCACQGTGWLASRGGWAGCLAMNKPTK